MGDMTSTRNTSTVTPANAADFKRSIELMSLGDFDQLTALVRERAARCADVANRVIRALDQDQSLNSLGEMQGSGTALDQAISARDIKITQVNMMARIVAATYPELAADALAAWGVPTR